MGLFLFVPLTSLLVDALLNKGGLTFVLPLVILALVSWLWFGTRYLIKGDKLVAWAGFIPYPPVAIQKIIRIKPTRSFIAAPACSMDRLLVQYGTSDYIIVSPKDKQGFVQALLARNQNIEVQGDL